MRSSWFAGAAILLAVVATSFAVPTITVGVNEIPQDSNQGWVNIYVTGGDQIAGFDLVAQVMPVGGDPDSDFSGPTIYDIDFITGTIFETNNAGSSINLGGGAGIYQYANGNIVTNTGTVAADGLLCRIQIDAIGFLQENDPNTWELRLAGAAGGSGSGFRDNVGVSVASSVTNGMITLTPEPATMVLLAMGGLALLRRRRAA